MKIEERIKYHKYILTFKDIKQEVPSYLSVALSYVSETNSCAVTNGRNGNLNIPKQKTELFRTSFAYIVPFLWNCLPTS
jgi:hypothetical protein